MVTPPDPNKIVIERNIVSRLVFDPIIARQLANWLNEQVEIYESIYGKIKVPEGADKNPVTETEELKNEENIKTKK